MPGSANMPIYLDYHATTPVDPDVFEQMRAFFCEKFGNAASRTHAFGWEAEEAVELARERVAVALGANPKEIVFTSGATESNNLAILGAARAYRQKGRHLITSRSEHNAVLDPCRYLEKNGWEITRLPVDRHGSISLDQLREAIRDDTVLVSIMAANNEVGTLAPVGEIGAVCKERGVLFHTDAAQAFGKIPLGVNELGIDLLSISAHKLYGPKGVGALYVRRRSPRVRLEPILFGGGHEGGLRSGTLPVPLVVGLGAATQKALELMVTESARIGELRDSLEKRLLEGLEGVRVNGHPSLRLYNNLNMSFECVEGETLIMGLKGIALSSGSACTSASMEPSHVLRAMGVPDELAFSSIRFGLGRFTTAQEIDQVAVRVIETVRRLRELSPDWKARKASGTNG